MLPGAKAKQRTGWTPERVGICVLKMQLVYRLKTSPIRSP